jgi:NAD-dependent SIR2 family protein deacetylase
VRKAIDDLARSDRVRVVAGAGASMEIGLPSWEDLVVALLDEAIASRGWTEDEDAFRTLVEESLDAYMDLAYAPFSYFRQGLEAARNVVR